MKSGCPASTGEIRLELGIVLFQALAAIWFARLFRETDAFAAGALALFGMVNAVVILARLLWKGLRVDPHHRTALSGGSFGGANR